MFKTKKALLVLVTAASLFQMFGGCGGGSGWWKWAYQAYLSVSDWTQFVGALDQLGIV